MKRLFLLIAVVSFLASACAMTPPESEIRKTGLRNKLERYDPEMPVVVGAARVDVYRDRLMGKRLALLSNQTGMVGDRHTLDVMLEAGLNVVTIFSPEHGFRGNADAGEHVSSGVDEKTGIPIASLYDGKNPMPSAETMAAIDIIVIDLQDVGLRFYTYYVTMIHLMDAAARYGKQVVVFDRPNPNIMTVDGTILDVDNLKSGVGWIPIPTVYGMTMGELALMVNGEHWLEDGKSIDLAVIECDNYTRQTRYRLPIAPSPNLPNMLSIYLYPSTCYFEGTPISLGRGTEWPFQVYGYPTMTGCDFSFTPHSRPGAKNPPCLDRLCYGVDLRSVPEEDAIKQGINLDYVIDAYHRAGLAPDEFFTRFFDLLMGDRTVKQMIIDGYTSEQIKATWQDGLRKFKRQREPYLLYPDPDADYSVTLKAPPQPAR